MLRDTAHDVLDDEVLNPLEDQLRLVLGFLDAFKVLRVDRVRVQQLECHGSGAKHQSPLRSLVPHIVSNIVALQLSQDHGVQEAHQAHEELLESFNLIGVLTRIFAKRKYGASSIKPITRHLMQQSRSIPKPRKKEKWNDGGELRRDPLCH